MGRGGFVGWGLYGAVPLYGAAWCHAPLVSHSHSCHSVLVPHPCRVTSPGPPPVGNTPTPRPTPFSIPPALLDPVPRGPLGVVVPPGPRDGEEVGGGTPFPIVPRGAARLLERVVRAPSVVGWGGWVLYGGGTTTLRRRWEVWGGGLEGPDPIDGDMGLDDYGGGEV